MEFRQKPVYIDSAPVTLIDVTAVSQLQLCDMTIWNDAWPSIVLDMSPMRREDTSDWESNTEWMKSSQWIQHRRRARCNQQHHLAALKSLSQRTISCKQRSNMGRLTRQTNDLHAHQITGHFERILPFIKCVWQSRPAKKAKTDEKKRWASWLARRLANEMAAFERASCAWMR